MILSLRARRVEIKRRHISFNEGAGVGEGEEWESDEEEAERLSLHGDGGRKEGIRVNLMDVCGALYGSMRM